MGQSDKLNAVIIGAGIASLAAAIRLSACGLSVVVCEQSSTYGGKLGVWQKEGFRFDTGPSLFTMPDYVLELLQIDGKNNVSFSYDKLDVLCNYFWEDDTRLVAYHDADKLMQEFEQKLNEPAKNIRKFLRKSAQKYNVSNHVFLEKSLHRSSTYLNWKTIVSMMRIRQVGVFKNMNSENQQLFDNPKTVQFFNRYATYNGSNPYKSPATLNVIPHYEFGIGAYFPNKGMRSIVDVLYQKALKLGVEFKFNTPVNRLIKSKDGYRVDDEKLLYDIVLCNSDVATAVQGPLKGLLKPKTKQYEPSSSALIFYWGISRVFDELDLHNIFFSADYNKEFHSIFEDGTIDDDPTVYVQISSKLKHDDAPKGKENWFVMVNAPYVVDQDWQSLIEQTRKNILTKLSRVLKVDVQSLIEVEHILTPQMIWDKTGSHKGALYGSSSNNKWSAFLRQPNFSKEHKGLYFCGGSVHPGGGIPLCLLSAKISTDIIKSDFKIC